MTSSRRMRLQAISCLVLLAGCATPLAYGPIGPETGPYGYRDTQNANGSYTLLVVTNDDALAHQFWERRAQELCSDSNYTKNIFRAEIPVVSYTGYATNALNPAYGAAYTEQRYGAFHLEGYLTCAPADQSAADSAATQAETAPQTPPSLSAAP